MVTVLSGLLYYPDSIQAYFGSSIAFYFSFLDFYTWALVPPALLGVTLMLLPILRRLAGGINTKDGLEEGEPPISGLAVQAVFNMLWSTMVMELWKRRTASLTYQWGTMQLTEHYAEPRPGYCGPPGCNPVTGRPEPCFPAWQRQLRVALVSVPVVGLFLVLVALGMASFYYCEALAKNFYTSYDSWLMTPVLYLPSVAHIVYGNMLGTLYSNVAQALSEWGKEIVEWAVVEGGGRLGG